MKLLKIACGVVAGWFALMHCLYLTNLLKEGAQLSRIMGSVAGLGLGAAISYALLKSALKQGNP